MEFTVCIYTYSYIFCFYEIIAKDKRSIQVMAATIFEVDQ